MIESVIFIADFFVRNFQNKIDNGVKYLYRLKLFDIIK